MSPLFLELRMTSQYDQEIDQCPKCEGIWLGKDYSENISDFTDYRDIKIQAVKDLQDTADENQGNRLENDYYYHKKPFKENGKLDDMFGFE